MTKVIRIRKNATKKINQLISQATLFELETHSTGLDDSSNSNGYTEVSREYLEQFIIDNYADLIVELKNDENGKPVTVWFQAGMYFFCPQIRVTFAPGKIETVTVEEENQKPRITMAALKAYLNAGFISPLNHGAKSVCEESDDEKTIESIKVIWSESSAFNSALRSNGDDINTVISIEEYNRLEWLTLAAQRQYIAKHGEGYGYDKTKLELTLKTGEVVTFRHDICLKERNLLTQWGAWVDYCRAEAEKKAIIH